MRIVIDLSLSKQKNQSKLIVKIVFSIKLENICHKIIIYTFTFSICVTFLHDYWQDY